MAVDKEQLATMVEGIADKLGDISVGLTQLATAIHDLPADDDPDDGGGDGGDGGVLPSLTATATQVDEDSVKVTWTPANFVATAWAVGRDGVDLNGSGPWATNTAGNVATWQFNSLRTGVPYTFTVTPTATVNVASATVVFTIPAPPTTGAGGEGDTAAAKLGWGTPDPISDEFESYNGKPDPAKWIYCGDYGVGWAGHNGNGKRMPDNSFVSGGLLTLRGDSNGNTGWLRQRKVTTYGRWEIRSRSRNTGTSGGLYHPLHLIWPNPEKWPENGELDFVEYTNPDAQQASAWLHYPHPKSEPIQQAGNFEKNCDMTQWHNFAFEWSKTGVRAWIDGVFWYEVKDGAGPHSRKNIQDMPAGSLTIQLDNFTGSSGLRPALFEIAWVRFYPV